MLISGQKQVIGSNWFEVIDRFIADNRVFMDKVQEGMDAVVATYAYSTLGFAQKRSAGPIDPQARGFKTFPTGRMVGFTSGGSVREMATTSTGAWKIPVRRITGKYYTGWYAQRLGTMTWRVANKSREAFFIEFGINHQSTGLFGPAGQRVRVRRPVLKLSVLDAIRFIQAHRVEQNMVKMAWTSSGSPGLVGGELYFSGSVTHSFATVPSSPRAQVPD